MNPDILTVVSVDVLLLRYDRPSGRVLLHLDRRVLDPYAGRLALPGVAALTGERLASAAGRACRKVDGTPLALGQLRTFDEPSRDPRGASLSIAMWAVLAPDGPASGAVPLAEVPPLPFDHDTIVETCRPMLAALLWRDTAFTRALTGAVFTSTDAVTLARELSGRDPHRANLNRELGAVPGLLADGTAPTAGGRPPKRWRWAADDPAR